MDKRVLSIQSHVAYGYVGGKAATFPLQLLGWDVDVVNTVNFSSHSGYDKFGGTRTTGSQLEVILESMEKDGLLHASRLLTGYVPNADALRAIVQVVKKLKNRDPKLVYLLDPVLGDAGSLYVSADIIPVYKELLLHSTIITPNWFEVETLTGITLDSIGSLRKALGVLHGDYGVPHIVVSSIPFDATRSEQWALPPNLRRALSDEASVFRYTAASLLCVSSSKSHSGKGPLIHAAAVPQLAGYYSGVGDLFSAMVLAHFEPSGPADPPSSTPLSRAASAALRITHTILRRTALYASRQPDAEIDNHTDDELDSRDEGRRARRTRARELKLIQSADLILSGGNSTRDAGEGDEYCELKLLQSDF